MRPADIRTSRREYSAARVIHGDRAGIIHNPEGTTVFLYRVCLRETRPQGRRINNRELEDVKLNTSWLMTEMYLLCEAKDTPGSPDGWNVHTRRSPPRS